MAKSVYDIIKKQNGEGFARVLRDKGLLDIPNIAHIVKYAGNTAGDAEQIFPHLWSMKEFREVQTTTNADPFQLLDMAGYHAFEVRSLDEQNSIKHFFRNDEELCTFHDHTRYQENYIIHAIKHEVWRNPYAIQPSETPSRQDKYGTSVISIQIRKDGGFISIKNRYNHSVDNPDQTFNSNPDEIIAGLSGALKRYFNVDWVSSDLLPGNFIVMNGQILKIKYEHNNKYMGDGFYTQNGQVIDIDKNSQIQMDSFIWDNNTRQLLNPLAYDDGFTQAFINQVQDKKITISGKYPNQTITADGVKVAELKDNEIVELNLPDITKIDEKFLYENDSLQKLSLPAVTSIEKRFMHNNEHLREILLPRVKTIGYGFLFGNRDLPEISLPVAEVIGQDFLHCNKRLQEISLPNATVIGDSFLHENEILHKISLPRVKTIGESFLCFNKQLREISLPCVTTIGNFFLCNNTHLQHISLPKATKLPAHLMIRKVDRIPQKPGIAQRFKQAILKFHNYIRMKYHTNSDYGI